MSQRVFINLPVKDLKRSKKFFAELGYSFDPHFSDDTAGALKLDADNTAMLLTHEKFKSFTDKPLPDPVSTVGVLVALALRQQSRSRFHHEKGARLRRQRAQAHQRSRLHVSAHLYRS